MKKIDAMTLQETRLGAVIISSVPRPHLLVPAPVNE